MQNIRLQSKKYLSLQKYSTMKEKIDTIQKYNLWNGNTIDCGFPRTLYTQMASQYLGGRVVKVLTGQRRVSFEYTMFAGLNDDKRHADALIRLLRGLECRVNLIRFHKIPDSPFETTPQIIMERFRDRLSNHGITCTIRASRGEDILAACGMLAGEHSRK